MRQTKIVKIDDQEITVKELRVKDIRKILSVAESLEGNQEEMSKVLSFATDMEVDKLEEFAPSELKLLWDSFREVNTVFFDIVVKSGIVEKMKSSILKHLTTVLQDSVQQGMNSEVS